MADHALNLQPGFLLLGVFLYYAGGGAALTAFLTAVLAHELGHLAALALAGARIRGIKLSAAGPVIEYGGALTPLQEAGAAAAGPVAGLLFAAACARLASPYFLYAGCISLLSAFFNLLPALPLDGGRLTLCLLRTVLPEKDAVRWTRISGSFCGACVAVTGMFVRFPPMILLGIWLALPGIFSPGQGGGHGRRRLPGPRLSGRNSGRPHPRSNLSRKECAAPSDL